MLDRDDIEAEISIAAEKSEALIRVCEFMGEDGMAVQIKVNPWWFKAG